MVRSNVALQDFDLVRSTDQSDELARSQPDITSQNRLAVLRDEHEVVVQLINAVRALAVPLHARTVPQAR